MTHHQLKTWPQFFQAMWDGIKTHEVRLDDRGFQKGDTVRLWEWDPSRLCDCRKTAKDHVEGCDRYTGRWLDADVGWITSTIARRGGTPGFDGHGYVVFSVLLTGASDPDLLGVA